MDWLASGIKNELIYKLVGFGLETEYEDYNVTSGTLTENYDGDCKSSLSIQIDGEEMPKNRLLRVYLRSSLGEESILNELGTFFFESQSLDYSKGRYTGSVSLQSTLYGLKTYKRPNTRTVKKGTNIKAHFESIVEVAKLTPYFSGNLNDEKNLGKAHIWGFGETYLTECNFLANSISGIIEPDTHGRVCLNHYLRPAKRAKSWTLDSGNCFGEISIGDPSMTNRVYLKFEENDKAIYGAASVDAGHEFSVRNIGRFSSIAEQLNELSPKTKAALNEEAEDRLASASDIARTFQVQTLWNPEMTCGSRGTLMLGELPIDCTITQRQIVLSPLMKMTLTLKEIV